MIEGNAFASCMCISLHIDPAQILSLNHKLGELYERLERPGKRYQGFLLSSPSPLYPDAVYLVGFNKLSTFQFSDLNNRIKYTLEHNRDCKGFHTLNLVILDYYNMDNKLANFVYNMVCQHLQE